MSETSIDALDLSVHRTIFARGREDTRNDIAIITDDTKVTYGEMNLEARRLSATLRHYIGHAPARVGVMSARNELSCIAILAVLHAGMTFVPLNVDQPIAALENFARQADLAALVVGDESLALAHDLLGRVCIPWVMAPRSVAPAAISGKNIVTAADLHDADSGPSAQTSADDIAYILSTSGTTGNPKGIPISHGNLRTFLDWAQTRYRVVPEDRLTQLFRHSFDLALFDMFMAWRNGAAVSLIDPARLSDIVARLHRDAVTIWFSVPSLVRQMADRGILPRAGLDGIRLGLFCGEPLTHGVARVWHAAAPHSAIDNLYGPTELTLACTVHRWTEPGLIVPNHEFVSIGTALPHLTSRILGEDDLALPENLPGELAIGGPQMFAGYWRAPELDKKRFVDSSDGVRIYKTGDRVVVRDGLVHFIGRTDDQIKIFGHRIELGEVEAALRSAGAHDAVAFAWPSNRMPRAIRALVTGSISPQEISAAAASKLQPVMRPVSVTQVDSLPRNSNGKIDKAAAIALLMPLRRTDKQGAIRGVIAAALNIAVEDVTDTLEIYSSASWDSLGHTLLMLAIEDELGIEIDPETASQLRSVADIEAWLTSDIRPEIRRTRVAKGLVGILMDRTGISHIDGARAMLEYRGYPIDDLLETCDVEEVFGLLIDGELPDPARTIEIDRALGAAQFLKPPIVERFSSSQDGDVLSSLAQTIAAEPAADALTVIGRVPAILGALRSARAGRPFEPQPDGPHEIRCARNLLGREPTLREAAFLREAMILHAEHGASASTLTLRTAISAGAPLSYGVGAAILTFAGVRHGGAILEIAQMFDMIGTPLHAADYVARHKVIPGFGHRIYQREDPRTQRMRKLCAELSHDSTDARDMKIAEALVDAMAPKTRMGVVPNIDLFATAAYRLLGIPTEFLLGVALAGRISGWCAHAAEQAADNVLIRPDLLYDGPARRKVDR